MVHKVVEGDTMYTIAKMHGVRLIDILKANPYVNVYNLQVGDEICVPADMNMEEDKRFYVAQSGDTIETIMNNTGSNIATLFGANPELYRIKVPEGTVVRIPDKRR